MGRMIDLAAQMLDEFLQLDVHDAHVEARRQVLSVQQRPVVATSVAIHRRINNATGIPETITQPLKAEGSRRVPDPMLTDAEYYYKRSKRPDDRHLGKVWVTENAMERIGALCFIRRKEAHHEMAAERFKSLYEARYGAGNGSMDPGRVQVDTSPIAHDSGMAAKIDRTNDLRDAETQLGKPAFDRLVALLVLCIPAGEGLSSRPRQRAVDAVLVDLDNLATVWRLMKRAAA